MTTTHLRVRHVRLSAPPNGAAPPMSSGWPTRIVAAVPMLVTAVGGVFGGVAMITEPLDALGATTSILRGSPFHTFLWPGVLLLILVGVIPAIIAVGILFRVSPALALGAAWGIGLMAWIVTQWVMLDETLWLQPLFFGIGLLVTLTAGLGLRRGLR